MEVKNKELAAMGVQPVDRHKNLKPRMHEISKELNVLRGYPVDTAGL